jgi:alkylation response protein AidB-like acyl-CoA dehydrogenase
MDFALNAEQEEFQRSLRRFITERSPLSKVRDVVRTDRGWDEQLWSQMSQQLGLPGLLVPEEYGGAGATMIEAALAMQELGRGLVPSPYYATTAFGVVPILEFGTEEQKAKLLPEIASGERTATTALTEPSGLWGPDGVTLRAIAAGDQVTLTGTKAFVIDGHTADSILVVALAPGEGSEFGWYLVDADAPGLTRTKAETLDLSRPMATLGFTGTPATPVGAPVPWGRVAHVLDVAGTLLAAEMVGGIEAAMTMSVEYAKVRHQFNRPIGSFQAIKHRAAEMAVELDTSRAAMLYAAYVASEGSDELALAAPVAKATAASGFAFTAAWNIQIHGGIGFTWEHDAHLYFRRAKADESLLGTVSQYWLELADRVGL